MGATDSKLAFRNAAVRLVEEKDIPSNEEENESFWDQIWNLPENASDVFSLLPGADVRSLLKSNPGNAETLIRKAADVLFDTVETCELPLSAEDVKRTLNAIRVLTRLLPYAFEMQDLSFENKIFWGYKSSGNKSPISPNKEGYTCLAERLLLTASCLLFVPGLTLPADLSDPEKRIHFIIWESGIGTSNAIASSAELDKNRLEVTRFFLALLSKTIYVEPSQIRNRWTHFLVTKLDKQTVLAILCSYLNVVIKYNPVGWVPYGHALFSDSREELVQASASILTVLLNYTFGLKDFRDFAVIENDPRSPLSQQTSPIDDSRSAIEEAIASQRRRDVLEHSEHINQFRYYLSRLHRTVDFECLMNGFFTLLQNPMEASLTYLPGSAKAVTYTEEILMLFWKVISVNDAFFAYICENEQVIDLMTALLFHAISVKNEPAEIGLVRLCCFVLHGLSAERKFALQLNQPFDHILPATLGLGVITGSYADFLALVRSSHSSWFLIFPKSIVNLITTTKSKLVSLYECLLTILANVSPYVKSFSVVASNKLLSLFNTFANPRFMLANETNHSLIFYLLDLFNNVIQYQFEGNTVLVYEIIRNNPIFFQLRSLTLTSAMKSQEEWSTRRRESAVSLAEGEKPVQETKGKQKEPIKFIPTAEWFENWHSQLPLRTIIVLLEAMAPDIDKLSKNDETATDEAIMQHLKDNTLVGVLPVPHPLFVRKFIYSEGIHLWFTGYLWGVIYLRHVSPKPSIWVGSNVKLFTIVASA